MIRDHFLLSTLALAGCAPLFACSTQIRMLSNLQPTPVAQLDASGVSSVVAGACSGAIVITREDADGAALVLATPTSVALAGLGSGGFYADSGCSSAISTATIPGGATSVTVYFRDTVAETLTLGFATGTADPGSRPLAVNADVPTTLTFSAATTVGATVCAPITVERRDQFGNLASPASATSVTLAGAGRGAFYTANTCATTTATTSIASGTSGETVYFKSAYVDPPLTLSATGLATPASAGMTVTGPFALPTDVAPATSGLATFSLRIASGDFDGDGKRDVVTSGGFGANSAYVAWGDGAGGFTAGPTLAAGPVPGGILATSLRGNGLVDIVVANYNASANSGNLGVILANGTRSLPAIVNYDSGGTMRRTADFATGVNLVNTSGKIDLVVTYYGDNTTYAGAGVEIFPGNGDGTLGAPTSLQLDGVSTSQPAVADVDHDGANDFLVPLSANGGANAAYYHNDGSNAFTRTLMNPGAPNYGNVFAFGDFNGDNLPDFSLGLTYYGLFANVGTGSAAVLTNTLSDQNFNDGSVMHTFTGTFTATGHTDVVFAWNAGGLDHNGVVFYPGHGDGTFGEPILYHLAANVVDLAMGDFNGDGKSDLVALTNDGVLHFLADQ